MALLPRSERGTWPSKAPSCVTAIVMKVLDRAVPARTLESAQDVSEFNICMRVLSRACMRLGVRGKNRKGDGPVSRQGGGQADIALELRELHFL